MDNLDNYSKNESESILNKADEILKKDASNLVLRSNVLNHLKLLMTATFEDLYCFIDEDYQNAQRAGATEFSVECNSEEIIICNNGEVLEDFQKLFSISESGWGDSIQESEQPFGMGFFSNIVIAKRVEVYSGNKMVVFEPTEMLKKNSVDIEEIETDENIQGVKLVLTELIPEYSSYTLKKRVKMIAKYSKIDVLYNSYKMESTGTYKYTGNKPHLNVNEEGIKGFVVASTSYFSKVNIYHMDRYVTSISSNHYIDGDLHLDLGIVNLKAPDRRGIIVDTKYFTLMEKLISFSDEISISIVSSGNEADIKEYSDLIEVSMRNEKVADKIKSIKKFFILDAESEKDSKYLEGLSLSSKDISTIEDYNASLSKISETTEEQLLSQEDEEVDYAEEVIETASTGGIDIVNKAEEALTVDRGEDEEDSNNDKHHRETTNPDSVGHYSSLNGDIPTFYATLDDIRNNYLKIGLAKLYKLKVIIPSNSFELNMLKSMRDRNIIHIEELSEDIEVKGEISSTTLTNKEARAKTLLSYASALAGLDCVNFIIGNLICYKKIRVAAICKEYTDIDDEIVACLGEEHNSIYVDRSIIENVNLVGECSSELTTDDIGFILTNLEMIIKNLNLLNPTDSELTYYRKITSNLGKAVI